MKRGEATSRLVALARELELEARVDDGTRFTVYLPGFATITIDETESSTLMVAIWVRSSSNDWPGERTDLNELFAVMISFALHSRGVSTEHIVVGHPVVDLPGEVYATYLVPRQPYPTGFPTAEQGLSEVEELIVHVSLTPRLGAFVLERCGWDGRSEGAATQSLSKTEAAWLALIEGELGIDHEQVTFNARSRPDWTYARTDRGLSIYRSKELASGLAAWLGHATAARYDGPTGVVLRRDGLLNFVDRRDLDLCRRLLGRVDTASEADLSILAIDNRVMVLANEHVVLVSADASRSAAAAERERIARRHASEHALLFENARVHWSDRVPGDRFEELVKHVLEQEPGVRRVRFAGGTNEQDGGRDLLVEWDTPLLPIELDPDSPAAAYRTRRVVVQCKSDIGAVGIRRVSGVGDTLSQYEADGYLLVVRSRLTRPLVDRLDQRRASGRAWIEWWAADELERRLLAHRHVAAAFKDLVTIES
jgi:Restriction endonuclease